MTQQDSLDEAAAYIKKLKERVDELQQKRSSAQLSAAKKGGGIVVVEPRHRQGRAAAAAPGQKKPTRRRPWWWRRWWRSGTITTGRAWTWCSSAVWSGRSSCTRWSPCWRKKVPRSSTPTSPSPATESSTPSTLGYTGLSLI